MIKKSFAVMAMVSVIAFAVSACTENNKEAETEATRKEAVAEMQKSVGTERAEREKYGEHIFKAGTNNSSPHPLVQGLEQFSKILSEKTDGKMSIKIYDGGQLGDKSTQIQMMQTGALDVYTCASGTLADYGAPDVAVYNLPYLFENVEQARAAQNSQISKDMIQYIDSCDIGMLALGSFVESGRCWFAVKAVTAEPDTLKGMKLRSQDGTIYAETAEAFGVSATSVAFSELYSALQTGIVDGADQPVSGFASNQFQEVCKYFIKDEHEIAPAFVLFSEATWNKLNDAEKLVVQESFDEAVLKFNEIATAADGEYYNQIADAGVTVIEVEPSKWQEVVKPLYEKYSEKWGTYIEAFRSVEY